MNERIKKLAEQCSSPERFDVAKFAELIVRECADVCSNVLDYHAILEKFGVE